MKKLNISSFTSGHFKIYLCCVCHLTVCQICWFNLWPGWLGILMIIETRVVEGTRPNTLMVLKLMLPQIMVRFSHWSWLLLLTNDTNIWPSENILIMKLINGNYVIWQICLQKTLGFNTWHSGYIKRNFSRWKYLFQVEICSWQIQLSLLRGFKLSLHLWIWVAFVIFWKRKSTQPKWSSRSLLHLPVTLDNGWISIENKSVQ